MQSTDMAATTMTATLTQRPLRTRAQATVKAQQLSIGTSLSHCNASVVRRL